MSFDWRSELSAFQVALIHETAKRYADWYAGMGHDWDSWEDYDSKRRERLIDQMAELFLVAEEARVALLRSGLKPVFSETAHEADAGAQSAGKPSDAGVGQKTSEAAAPADRRSA